ncbi:DUF4234 domain-containing protein [Thermoactinomyces mirandus]|uniref:DUF4234 domain-containing protein n=1 Tax=Thermoactinomyces mirandus TaxID=2756294 RepID=A0A7W1XV33_9BACL|nr:DUF4234 domain-containing protein [Thermoactinomyces mirandus]MBA4603602.1 DUF4234 domain-containing protein [Thermoactinomyces mirandus]
MTAKPSYRNTFQTAGFKKVDVALMIVLSLVTFGLYIPYWYVSRQKAIENLNTQQKFPFWIAWVIFVCYLVDFIISIASFFVMLPVWYGMFSLYAFLFFIPIFIGLNIILRRMMLEHERKDISFSNNRKTYMLTFLFTIFYLQYLIDKERK